ncbi:hypothetical protein [Chryseobacterium sp. 3008163]|uniref:hypothetical protein n=1 Tax=Chryseobacterium sp. 3008163 TaxID=2478663 RepID=UPI000F0BFE5A|nr:hypothetical protein [Chryseobacterium sp. 3008163]AYN00610.1 hypothetical protein EAG08_10050 [Chryseobacterium sp. 3008163]
MTSLLPFRLLIILFYFIFTGTLFSQQKIIESGTLLADAQQVLYSDPEQSLKFATSIIKNSSSSEEIIQGYLLTSKSYFIEGKYDQALEASENAKRIATESKNDSLRVSSLLLLAEILNFLNITDLSKKYDDEAKQIIKENSKLYNEFKEINVSEIVKNRSNISPEINLVYAKITKGTLFTQIAKSYLEKSDYDNALYYFSKNVENLEKQGKMEYWEIQNFIYYSDCFFINKQYEIAVKTLYKAVERQKKLITRFMKKRLMKN